MNGTIGYSFSLYVKPLTAEFGWNRAAIMAGSTIMFLTMGLLGPFVGRIANSYGANKLIATGALLLGICFSLLSTITSLWQFYLYYVIGGIGAACMGMVPTSTVISNWFQRRRGFAVGILGSGIGVGGLIMPLIIGGLLIENLGWRTAYLISGLIIAVPIIPLSLLTIKTRPSDIGLSPDGTITDEENNTEQKNAKTGNGGGINLKSALHSSSFWLMAVAFACFSFSNSATMQNQVPHLQDIDFPVVAAASALSAVGIGSAVGKFGFGWLCDLIPPKYTLAIGILCQTAGVFILLNLESTSAITSIWIYAFLFGLGLGSWLPAMSMLVSTNFGMAAYGAIFGTLNLVFGVGGSIGPVLAGAIHDANGNYFWAFVISLCLYGISLPTILLVKNKKLKAAE
jgi:MFS family permease